MRRRKDAKADAVSLIYHPHCGAPWVFDLYCLERRGSDNSVMAEHTYKKIELVGSSPQGFQAAVENALARANATIRNMRWFEVVDMRGQIEDGKVNHWQVTLKVGFTLDK